MPDLDGNAKLVLKSEDGDEDLACIQSSVGNGKSIKLASISYVAAGIAGGALAVSGLAALSAAGQPGTATSSPGFIEVVHWYQSIAMDGMLSIPYPPLYRSFAENFAFSTGLVEWESLQTAIDNFRAMTGGDLSLNSFAALKQSIMDNEKNEVGNLTKRALEGFTLVTRQVDSSPSDQGAESESSIEDQASQAVDGIQGYVERLMIPDTNTFMTVLLVFAIVVASITVGILLFKGILEGWAMFGSFPKSLAGFRERYWWFLAKTLTNLILLLYGIWTLYCVYQFTNGDSWAAKALAGATLGIFTAILVFFTVKIWQHARRSRGAEGGGNALYDDKQTWVKYSIFYENYKKSCWWIFVPTIIYMFAKGCIIAGADGHGNLQAGGQLIVEGLLLCVLLFLRPYSLTSGNLINVIIQIVRVFSVICILVFVDDLGYDETVKTVTGVTLVVMQSVLTGVLAILIAVNAIVMCCRNNPHRKKRKELGMVYAAWLYSFSNSQKLIVCAERRKRGEVDALTPLDARNSLLMAPDLKNAVGVETTPLSTFSKQSTGMIRAGAGAEAGTGASMGAEVEVEVEAPTAAAATTSDSPPSYFNFSHRTRKCGHSSRRQRSNVGLLSSAAEMGSGDHDDEHDRDGDGDGDGDGERGRSPSPPPFSREPRLPDVGLELRGFR